jgi:hypothetical protein
MPRINGLLRIFIALLLVFSLTGFLCEDQGGVISLTVRVRARMPQKFYGFIIVVIRLIYAMISMITLTSTRMVTMSVLP